MINILFSIVTSRLVWGFVGISALSFIIWIIGPIFSIADARPLEPEANRMVSISLLWLFWIISNIVPRIYNAWLNRKLVSGLESGAEDLSEESRRLNSEEQVLAERFGEAAEMLKKAHFSQHHQKKPRWYQRFSRQYLYQLPWYVIIGAPGAGKTTALVNSGLQFPLADRFGKTALRGIGGTRNCDWWFTNEAVLLDTAGRYTTQESQQQQDASEWLRFTQLLKKFRARQPINGVIITISVTDLLTLSAEARQKQAISLRQRLTELHEQLGIRFPVYILVTKADLLKGFRAWFARFDKAQRDQIWGFTFAREHTGQPDFDLITAFNQEFALLQQRLNAGLAETLLAESDVMSRADCFLFPQEFSALRPLLADYLTILFARSSFETQFLPRGVYLASGTQEGLPFDRVMGDLARSLDLPDSADKQPNDNWKEVSQENPVPGNKGQSFFLHQMLKNVVFKESGLAGSNHWWELRSRALLWSGYVLLLLLLLMVCGLWLISFSHNKDYLAEVAAKEPQVKQQSQQLSLSESGDLVTILPFMNTLRHLPESVSFDLSDPPLTRRMGLYRGEEVSAATETLYQKALQQLLLPQVAQRITTWLNEADGSDADYIYEALKAYQMLYQPKQYDGQFLYAWVMLNIRRDLPPDMTQAQLKKLQYHLHQLLETRIQASPYARDEQLIKRAQEIVQRIPLSQRVYGRLKRLLEQDTSLRPVSVVELAGPQGELVFSRKSGKSLSEGIPGLFTPVGYHQYFSPQIDPVMTELARDDLWVLGRVSPDDDQTSTQYAVRQLYTRDFIQHWDGLLADIQLTQSADLTQRINSVRLLSGPHSPLRKWVVNVSQYLLLERPADGNQQEKGDSKSNDNRASQTLQKLFRSKQNVSVSTEPQTPEQQVTTYYAPFIELAQPVDDKGDNLAFDNYLRQIDDLYRHLIAVRDAANSGVPAPAGEAISNMQASGGRLPGSLQSIFSTMAVGASSDTRQRDLDNLRKRIATEVGSFCRQAIAGRYPFARSARNEVTPDDLARMFAPGGGLMDNFFRENLTGKVDTTHSQWRFMPGIDGKALTGGEQTLRSFQQAQSIRDAFFTHGATSPAFRTTIRTIKMDNDILTMALDVDGQLLRYSHGPQAVQQVNWPGSGGTSQVRLSLGLANGTSATMVTNGFWALNRLFDRGKQQPGSSALSRQVTFNIDGHQVTLEFIPNSIRNPFQLPGFSCP